MDDWSLDLEALVRKWPPGPLFNNAAQHWNHSFYWKSLAGKNLSPSGAHLAAALDKAFGSRAEFEKQFSAAALGQFGSGWAWSTWTIQGTKSLKIDKDHCERRHTLLTTGKIPLFTCDVWEHAYYIDYRNARAKYVEAFWKIVNWEHRRVAVA